MPERPQQSYLGKIVLIGWREFRHTALTKGFIFGAIALPVLMFGVLALIPSLISKQSPPLKGTIVVVFDVDSTGKVLDLQFNPTKDGSYNRKLREALIAIRFRPAVNAQGVPVRARTEITYSL